METLNAKIESTMLGVEDHGILTFFLYVEGAGWSQSFGGHACDRWDENKSQRVGHAFGMEAIRRILETVGVETWEALPGKNVRVRRGDDGILHHIGHIVEDRWYDIKAHSARPEAPKLQCMKGEKHEG